MDNFNSFGILGTLANGQLGVPILLNQGEQHDLKLSKDRYEVFVNGDKVGDKILQTQVETSQDLEAYLKENGFPTFNYQVKGGHIEIEAGEDSGQMKEILSSYLQTN